LPGADDAIRGLTGPRIALEHISKTFTAQRALDDVSLTFSPGSVTALLGQNGSGKSTLIKVLAGVYSPDPGGVLRVDDVSVPLPVDPGQVHRLGLRFMHQDLGLIDTLSILDNFSLPRPARRRTLLAPLRRRAEYRRTAAVLGRLGIDADPGTLVGALDATTKTMIAIARAVQDSYSSDQSAAHVLVLDEPTAALPDGEAHRVLRLVRNIAADGGSVVYVSHRVDEVLEVSDRVVILRDGRLVAERETAGLGAEALVALILGHEPSRSETPREQTETAGDVVLRLSGITGRRLRDIDLDLRPGEIVGVTGLVGCGRSELARIVAGAQRPESGQVLVGGREVSLSQPADALGLGICYVPQDRAGEGCIPAMTLYENLTLGSVARYSSRGWLSLRREQAGAAALARKFNVKPPDPARLMAQFSGGNQQKAVIAKAVQSRPRILVLDEPMQGIDIGAKAEIAGLLHDLAAEGMAVLVGSTDVEDLTGLCDRVLVLNRGRTAGFAAGRAITKERLTVMSAHATAPEIPA
jgi:ribose transport system ATP-binding protein